MIVEDYITFEQGKLLKEKGFPQVSESNNYFNINGDKVKYTASSMSIRDLIFCPSLSLVQKWIKKEKGIELFVEPIHIEYKNIVKKYVCQIEGYRTCGMYESYEEALSGGIDRALEII